MNGATVWLARRSVEEEAGWTARTPRHGWRDGQRPSPVCSSGPLPRRVFEHLAGDADNAYAMIDATMVRAHQHAAGAKGGTRLQRASGAAKAD
jgi:hypothetical protein